MRDIPRQLLCAKVAMVEQEPFLFPASIRENILYGLDRDSRENRQSSNGKKRKHVGNWETNVSLWQTAGAYGRSQPELYKKGNLQEEDDRESALWDAPADVERESSLSEKQEEVSSEDGSEDEDEWGFVDMCRRGKVSKQRLEEEMRKAAT